MDGLQKTTNDDNKTKVVKDDVALDPRYQELINWQAVNGLIVNEEGTKKMSFQDLADILKVNRVTLYKWKDKIPDYWVRVNDRRKELSGQNRMAQMHQVWELKAMKGDWQFFNAWMLNFNPDYRVPTQKIEHEAGQSMVELMGKLKELQTAEPEPDTPPPTIEARIIDSAETATNQP